MFLYYFSNSFRYQAAVESHSQEYKWDSYCLQFHLLAESRSDFQVQKQEMVLQPCHPHSDLDFYPYQLDPSAKTTQTMPYSQACFSSYLHQFLPPKCRRQDRLHQHSDLISTMAKPLLRHWPWKLLSYHHLISVFAMLTFLPLDHGHPKMFLWPVSDPYYY